MKSALALFAFCLFAAFASQGQAVPDSSKADKYFKNTIRYNLSGPLLFGFNYIVFGYERVLNNKQSISVNAGRAVLPKIVEFSTDDVTLTSNRNNSGINFSVDYRFYMAKENRHRAPRGIYLGPYYSYNQFNRESEWKLNQSSGSTTLGAETKMDIHTIGAELGCQFILWNRLALDFIMVGPGFSNYKINTKTDGNLSAADQEKLLEGIEEMLSQKFPGMDIVLEDQSFSGKGTINTWATGYRYIFHIGFRF
jgi:Protein of unknown function (DUF3575)